MSPRHQPGWRHWSSSLLVGRHDGEDRLASIAGAAHRQKFDQLAPAVAFGDFEGEGDAVAVARLQADGPMQMPEEIPQPHRLTLCAIVGGYLDAATPLARCDCRRVVELGPPAPRP